MKCKLIQLISVILIVIFAGVQVQSQDRVQVAIENPKRCNGNSGLRPVAAGEAGRAAQGRRAPLATPTILIIETPFSQEEMRIMTAVWARQRRQHNRDVQIILARPSDVIIDAAGDVFALKGRIVSDNGIPGNEFVAPEPIKASYLYGEREIVGASGITLAVPCESNAEMRQLENDKESQIELARRAGIPTKRILDSVWDEYDYTTVDTIARKLKHAEQAVRRFYPGRHYGHPTLYVQPVNMSKKAASCYIFGDRDIPDAAKMIFAALESETTRKMLILDYIPSVEMQKDFFKGVSIKDKVESNCVVNHGRVIVAYDHNSYGAVYIGPMPLYAAGIMRGKTYFKWMGITREGEVILQTSVQLKRFDNIDDFLPFCKKSENGEPLSQDEQRYVKERIIELARKKAEAVIKAGCSFDILAVDYIISRNPDRNGLPTPYFIECASHFSSELVTLKEIHFDIAYKRALQYKNATGAIPLCATLNVTRSLLESI